MSKFPHEPSWSPVGPYGARVRVLQRGPGAEARLVFTAADGCGYDEEPLGFGLFDAEGKPDEERLKAAKREAAKFSNLRLAGELPGDGEASATLGEAADWARDHMELVCKKADSERRRRSFRRRLKALERFFGRDFVLADLTRTEWDDYHERRMTGRIDSDGEPVSEKEARPVSPATASDDLQVLRQLCRRARGVRELALDHDPTRDFDLPTNDDPRRVRIHERGLTVEKLRKALPQVKTRIRGEGENRWVATCLPWLFEVALGTGRRIGSILALEWRDWAPEEEVKGWSVPGTLTFRGEADKRGRSQTVPVLPETREALLEWRTRQPDIVPPESPIWPSPTGSGKPLDINTAIRWLQKAERKARGRHVKGFGFHACRREWAIRMQDRLSPGAAALLGGWSGPHCMQQVYQRLPETEAVGKELGRVFELEAEAKAAEGAE